MPEATGGQLSNLKSDFKLLKLGDLEFKAEFFENLGYSRVQSYMLAKSVNDSQSERLEKAQEVFSGVYTEYDNEPVYWSADFEDCTHRARLVCIEEIKK